MPRETHNVDEWRCPATDAPFAGRFPVGIPAAPIFLANMVFAQRFRNVGDSTAGFGANLLRAMAGGVLEYASLVVGYHSLLIMVAAFYGLAFMAVPARLWRTPPPCPAGLVPL